MDLVVMAYVAPGMTVFALGCSASCIFLYGILAIALGCQQYRMWIGSTRWPAARSSSRGHTTS